MYTTESRPSPRPLSTKVNLRAVVAYLLASAAALIIATLLDRPLWQALLPIDPHIGTTGWAQVLRSLGCTATRLLDHAHFASDTVLAAMLAFAVVRCVWCCNRHLDDATREFEPPR